LVVVEPLLRIGQAQAGHLRRAAATLLGSGDRRAGVLGDGAEVTAAALQVALQLLDGGAVVAGGHGLVQPFGRLGVVALLGIGRRQLFGHLALLGTTDLAVYGFQRLDGRAHVAGALRSGCLHAVDRQLLGGRLAAHGIGFTCLGQGFLGLAGAQQFAGLLQGLADLGPHALGLRRWAPTAASDNATERARRWARGCFMGATGEGQRNCSLPTMPILVTPSRWAVAMIIATCL
jgi:hypothetical protein